MVVAIDLARMRQFSGGPSRGNALPTVHDNLRISERLNVDIVRVHMNPLDITLAGGNRRVATNNIC